MLAAVSVRPQTTLPSSPMTKQTDGAELGHLGAGRCLMLVGASVRACDTSRACSTVPLLRLTAECR